MEIYDVDGLTKDEQKKQHDEIETFEFMKYVGELSSNTRIAAYE